MVRLFFSLTVLIARDKVEVPVLPGDALDGEQGDEDQEDADDQLLHDLASGIAKGWPS